MLVQRRIQEEIHGNKPTINGIHPPKEQLSTTKDDPKPKILNGQHIQSDEKIVSAITNDQQKKSPTTNTSIDHISPLSDDDDMSTSEIVARNQSSKLDFHKTMTPMFVYGNGEEEKNQILILYFRIGKENFELRKKLFEHNDESSFAGNYLSILHHEYPLL